MARKNVLTDDCHALPDDCHALPEGWYTGILTEGGHVLTVHCHGLRRVWSYQRYNQNPYIEEHTTQWPKEKV